jgi:hypothetical protein
MELDRQSVCTQTDDSSFTEENHANHDAVVWERVIGDFCVIQFKG